MKAFLMFVGPLLVTAYAHTQPLRCKQLVAYGDPSFFEVNSKPSEKILFAKADGHRVYLSEKDPRTFELEAYIVENEIRVYSKATLKEDSDLIELSYWSRDQMLQWSCNLMP